MSALVLMLLVSCIPVMAHTEFTANLTCPLDNKQFTYVLDASGTTFTRRLDMKPMGPTAAPWRIGQCPSCGFVLYKKEFTDAEKVRLREIVETVDYHTARKLGSTYYCLSHIYRKLGEPAYEIAWVLLQASWQVESDKGRYTTCLQEALVLLDSVVRNDLTTESFADSVAAPTDPHVAAYLCIELNRLMGDFAKAEQYLALMRPLTGPKAEGFNKLVECQRVFVAARDSKHHTVEACK